ncbi:MarR family winged helix-turn-helix transcriptional regulator [Bacillus weihaiensis]|uniref:MarR family transcriptional regulator n=1 Tax=Bacillus weihaiensis TaxID=1547283 RepID=A0A1L3MQL2_9BACI|nr:MarR family transcriptional regulator [Bacillus weihaiensis]APH04645.1 MarR family transcriptional regulator [Bacillus weihaiensis]
MDNTNQLFHLLYQKTRHMTKELNGSLQKHELFSSQWSILYCLMTKGSMTQSEIWRYLGVEAPTVTRTLIKLEEFGWIQRSSGQDKRERLVSLTEKAYKQLPFVEDDVKTFEKVMISNLTSEEQNQLYYLLSKLGEKSDME